MKPGDKFQRIHQASATESQQHARTKGANVTGPGNVLQIQATNSNVDSAATSNTKNNNFAHSEEDKEQQEQDGLYKDVEQLQQQQQQPNNASKNNNNNSHPANNIDSTIQKFISNSLTGQAANSSNFFNYEYSKYGVKLQYPSDWVYMEGNSNPSNTSLSPQIIVIFTSLKSLQQQPITSLGIGVMNLGSRKITLDEFTKLNLNNLRESNPDFQLIGSNSITLFGSNQANELVYTAGGEKKHHCTLFTIIAEFIMKQILNTRPIYLLHKKWLTQLNS